MKVKLIDFGGVIPVRAHYNDAGMDVFANLPTGALQLKPHAITKIPLGIGIELPDGLVAFVVPRSGLSTKSGLTTEVVPIDSGYRGEIHAIVYNATDKDIFINDAFKIAQLVVLPVVMIDFVFPGQELNERDDRGFGSTGN